ncbi:MAG TPA: lipase maturation factor family protein [Bryobacteraceae bacterium]|nr:lipase maturation factor family protein [Bryobacteraceae bacterium]
MSGKPLVIFDGRCGFCRIWIEYWKQLTGDRVDYAPSQEAGVRFPQIPPENFSQSVQLVTASGEVISGASAVFTILTYAPGLAWLSWLYQRLPGFAPLSEAAYKLIAGHRNFFDHVTRFTFGRSVSPLSYARVEWLFLRILALIYCTAFWSLAVQITGLAGARGILPAARYLEAAKETFGVRAYWLMPGLFWIAPGDTLLRALCWAGVAISIILFLGYWERFSLVSLYVLFLSLGTVGQDFLAFQWDMLLLEAGFLAIFLGSSKWIVFLFRWLLFRLMFLSGSVKLLSHDASWRNLSAMSFHYFTQPLPTRLAWYAYQLPFWFQRFTTASVLVIELAVPWLILGPRPWRSLAAWILLAFQTLIFLTGNYTYFNLLAMALCLFLFDDRALSRLRLGSRAIVTRPGAVFAMVALVLLLSVFELDGVFFDRRSELENSVVRVAAPFGVVNTYGLFAVMTTTRPEIIVQGSLDGATWLDYEFPFKPGNLQTPPRWAAPYQPRLDWQMWFAALSGFRGAPWFGNFMVRLLQGSPDVARLLSKNPFPAPPKYVRALLFDYEFTNWEERRNTGAWWKRVPRGIYLRAISLADVR